MKTNDEESSHATSRLGFSLELGSRFCSSKKSRSGGGFTFLQLQELQHQFLIYKYMETGLPVPHELIIPIWKSVSSSLDGLNFLRSSCWYGEYRSSVEPEPGRCRRTDGKKWRCSKVVVPNQKYCQRHMHRGRQRSRKHVEPSANSTAVAKTNAADAADSDAGDLGLLGTNLSISLSTGGHSQMN